jgi:hypothetical protein
MSRSMSMVNPSLARVAFLSIGMSDDRPRHRAIPVAGRRSAPRPGMWSGADGATDRERENCDGDHIADDRGLVAFNGIGTPTGGPSHEHTTCRQHPGASGVGVIRTRIDDPFQLAAGSEGGCDDNQHGDINKHGDTPQRRRAWQGAGAGFASHGHEAQCRHACDVRRDRPIRRLQTRQDRGDQRRGRAQRGLDRAQGATVAARARRHQRRRR